LEGRITEFFLGEFSPQVAANERCNAESRKNRQRWDFFHDSLSVRLLDPEEFVISAQETDCADRLANNGMPCFFKKTGDGFESGHAIRLNPITPDFKWRISVFHAGSGLELR
jgi:hypothetical protein